MRKAFIQLHIAIFLAGFTGILGRLIELNEGLLVWYRLLLTSIILWAIYFFTRKNKDAVSFKKNWRLLAVGVLVALHWIFFYGSIKYANVSVGLVCLSAIAFFTSLLEPLVFKKKINRFDLLLGLVVIFGIYIIFSFDTRYKTGIIIGIISSFFASLFPILNRKLLAQHNAEEVTLYELTGGFIFLTLLMPLYTWLFPAPYYFPTLRDWWWLLFLSLLCTVWAFNLAVQALKKISAFTVNLSYNLEPLYGILLAFIVYHENKLLKWSFYVGFAVILSAVILQMWRVKRQMGNR